MLGTRRLGANESAPETVPIFVPTLDNKLWVSIAKRNQKVRMENRRYLQENSTSKAPAAAAALSASNRQRLVFRTGPISHRELLGP